MPQPLTTPAVTDRVKAVLRRDLKLGPDAPLEPDTPLFGGELDLDSIDALLLVASIEKEFGIKVPNEKIGRQVFGSLRSLADYILTQLNSTNTTVVAPAPQLDLDALLAALPHRDPFRFVTQLTSIDPGVAAEGLWHVTGHEAFLAGHFPGHPIVPGVLITEALAQLSGLLSLSRPTTPGADTPAQGRLAHTRVRFRAAVQPPAHIHLCSTLNHALGRVQHFTVKATCNNQVVADGELALGLGA